MQVDVIPDAPARVSALSPAALASVLDQSVDCVKLVGLEGQVLYMNSNGLCAMEIDDFTSVKGKDWASLWPEAERERIADSLVQAAEGTAQRFRAFCPTAKGTPRWWDVTVSAVTDPAGAHAGYLSISRDVTQNQMSREALAMSAAELKHRLGNTYMIVISLLTSFARGDAHNQVFATEMTRRLQALSSAQSLFGAVGASCDLTALIPALLSPFSVPGCRVGIAALPPVALQQGQADAIALVVGELSVNSSKHGALAHGGSIDIGARLDGARLTLEWNEKLDRPVERHGREGGKGLQLIQRITEARGGTLALEWREDGLTVRQSFDLG